MKSYQKVLISIFIGLIAFPTIGLGSSIVVSLIQGKTPTEAIQILAEQIDSLVSRVDIVETKQEEQEQTTSELQDIIDQQKTLIEQLQSKVTTNKACSDMYRYFKSDTAAEHFYQEALKYQQIHGIDDLQASEWLNEYELYLQAKQKCDSLFQ